MRLLPNRRIPWDSLHLAPGRPECLLAEPPGGRAINGPPLPGGFQVLHRIRKYSLIHPCHPQLQIESRNPLLPFYVTAVSIFTLFNLQ